MRPRQATRQRLAVRSVADFTITHHSTHPALRVDTPNRVTLRIREITDAASHGQPLWPTKARFDSGTRVTQVTKPAITRVALKVTAIGVDPVKGIAFAQGKMEITALVESHRSRAKKTRGRERQSHIR